MSGIVTFGELMLRLMPEGYNRFVQAGSFDVSFGGAEANVALSLANFGMKSIFVSKMPENQIGQAAVNSLRKYGVDVSFVKRGGDRLGIYFLEKGASQRSSLCIYDRKGSSFAMSSPEDYDWNAIFSGVSWFHVTGITPALSDQMAEITIQACKEAESRGIKVSCDLNYRSKLWSLEKAQSVMTEIADYVDVCIANEDDAFNVFGIKTEKTDTDAGIIDKEAYSQTARLMAEKFGFEKVAITLRKSINASNNIWSGMLFDGKDSYFSREYDVHIIERVGAGDSFAAGLIYSMMSGKDMQYAVDFAAAASCLKHSIESDYNHVSVAEVENLIRSAGTGRVIR